MNFAQITRCLTTLSIMAAACWSANATPAQTVRVTVDVNIEGQYVPSAMTLVVPLKRHLLLGAAPGELDDADQQVQAFVDAMARGDLETARKSWTGPIDTSPERSERGTETGLRSYLQFMKSFSLVRLLGRVPGADGELVLFSAVSAGKPIVRAFQAASVAGKLGFRGVDLSQRPSDSFLVNCFSSITTASQLADRMRLADAVQRARKQAPMRLNVNAGGTFLEVVAKRLQGSIPGSGADAPAAARLVEARILLMSKAEVGGLGEIMSADSLRRVETWGKSMNDDQKTAWAAAQADPRQAFYVLDADPVSLVVYRNRGDVLAHSAGPIAYEYVVQTAGRPRVANVLQHAIFDEFLRSNADFTKLALPN